MISLIKWIRDWPAASLLLSGAVSAALLSLAIAIPLAYVLGSHLDSHYLIILIATSLSVSTLVLVVLVAVLRDYRRTHKDITAENRALMESLALNKAVLNTTSDAILVVDRDDRPVAFNQRFIDLWKVPSPLAERARRDPSFRTAEFRAAVLHMLTDPKAFLKNSETLYSQDESIVEDTLFLKDGRRLMRYSSPQRVEGEVIGRIWSFHDITELHREKERLEVFRRLIDGSHDALLIVDPITSEILDCNARAPELHGYEREDFLSCRLIDINAGISDFTSWQKAVNKIEEQGMTMRIVENIRADGSIFPLELTARAVHVGGKRYIVASERDFSERQAMDLALSAERDLAQQLFDIQDTLLAVMQDGELASGNLAFSQFLGVNSFEEVQERGLSLIDRIVESSGYMNRTTFRNWLNGDEDASTASRHLLLRSPDKLHVHTFLARRRRLPSPDPRQLLALTDISELEAKTREVEHLAATDSLTGLLNRSRFNVALEQQLYMVRRYGSRFSLAMFDLDGFKAINDEQGHLVGDRVLTEIGRLLRTRLRGGDMAARWGGDEFMILMPETDVHGARAVIKDIRESMEDWDFGLDRFVHGSFGISQATHDDSAETIVGRVDEAMYRAKRSGGSNRIRVSFPVITEK